MPIFGHCNHSETQDSEDAKFIAQFLSSTISDNHPALLSKRPGSWRNLLLSVRKAVSSSGNCRFYDVEEHGVDCWEALHSQQSRNINAGIKSLYSIKILQHSGNLTPVLELMLKLQT